MITSLAMAAALLVQPTPTEVTAPGPDGPLHGTMLASTEGAPIILIIPGSGPTDRDGNSPLGVRASTYRLLAEALAGEGVTTVRIDKRGMFGSHAAVPDPNSVTIADYAADIRSWVIRLRELTGADCVWLLGHSEGGLVAMVAAQDPSGVCGLVLVNAPGRPVGDVMREQFRANPANAPVLDQALTALDRVAAGQPVDTSNMHPGLIPILAPEIQTFLRSLMSYDPTELLASYDAPVLVLQGQRDIQVGESDARRLAGANGRTRLVLLPHVNHVLKAVTSDDLRTNMATYADPGLPLADGVAETIAAFVQGER